MLVCTDNVYQGLVQVLLGHWMGGVELAFDQAYKIEYLVCDLLSAAVHDFENAGGCRVHQVLRQCMVFNVQDNWHLLLQKLKRYSALIANSEKS